MTCIYISAGTPSGTTINERYSGRGRASQYKTNAVSCSESLSVVSALWPANGILSSLSSWRPALAFDTLRIWSFEMRFLEEMWPRAPAASKTGFPDRSFVAPFLLAKSLFYREDEFLGFQSNFSEPSSYSECGEYSNISSLACPRQCSIFGKPLYMESMSTMSARDLPSGHYLLDLLTSDSFQYQPPNPRKQVILSLKRLVERFPPTSADAGRGLYTGRTSIALLFLSLSKHYNSLEINGKSLKEWCDTYISRAFDEAKAIGSKLVDFCGIAQDNLCILAMWAASRKDFMAVRRMCYIGEIVMSRSNTDNGWAYGRAGFLYLLRLARSSFNGSDVEDEETRGRIDDMSEDVIRTMLAKPELWNWDDGVQVGAEHGIIGIITQMVLTDPECAPQLEPRLDALLESQPASGRWPKTVPNGNESFIDFCQGAPGVVTSLLSIRDHFPNLAKRIDAAIASSRILVKHHGLHLHKEPNLSTGISGNALALDTADCATFLSHTTRSRVQMATRAKVIERSKFPDSLFCGEAGRAWAWAVLDLDLPKRFLGYNDI